jgi:transcriptional regulator with XRE-family HTH domain
MPKRKRKKKRAKKIANIVGPQIQKRRYEMGLTQEQLAARCQLRGLNISRGTLSQIEAQLRCVIDSELALLAQVLKVSTDQLLQQKLLRRRKG